MARGQTPEVCEAAPAASKVPSAAAAAEAEVVAPAAAATATPAPPATRHQQKWELLLDADLLDVVRGDSYSATMQRVAVAQSVRVWETSADGALSVCVLGSAPSVAKARAALCDALVAELSTDPKPAYVVPEPPLWSRPPAPVDWSMPGAAWSPYDTGMAPALAPLFPGLMQDAYAPAAMLPMQPYFDPSTAGFASFAPSGCGPTEELVHFTQQVPHALVGLVIGVKGASIHAVELASQCHLSLDRNYVYNDATTGVPFVLLHIHGVRSGAMQAVNMVTAILQRHVAALTSAPPSPAAALLPAAAWAGGDDAAESAPQAAEAAPYDDGAEAYAEEAPAKSPDGGAVQRSLFSDAAPSPADAAGAPGAKADFPALPTILSPPQLAPKSPGRNISRLTHRRRRVFSPLSDSSSFSPSSE